MMDQLASIGVEFDEEAIGRMIAHLEKTYHSMAEKESVKLPHAVVKQQPALVTNIDAAVITAGAARHPITTKKPTSDSSDEDEEGGCCFGLGSRVKSVLPGQEMHWAVEPFCENSVPIRPWGLGALLGSKGWMYRFAGHDIRSPGTYRKLDPMTGEETTFYLEDTNERMHSSVRVRLALKGLGLNDEGLWEAPALKGKWRLRKNTATFVDPIPSTVRTWEPSSALLAPAGKRIKGMFKSGDEGMEGDKEKGIVDLIIDQQRPLEVDVNRKYRWVWEWCGGEKNAPPQKQRLIVEEPLGPFERQLLRLTGGVPNVYEYAETVKHMDGRKI